MSTLPPGAVDAIAFSGAAGGAIRTFTVQSGVGALEPAAFTATTRT